eukprot:Pompholyxophrys_sp_v1_NODE_142_length_1604_cov_1.602970.p3 type:complete len:143 gc:universal NODE_142_length_1604_cov_1.602970:90-518(+)
MNFQSNFHLFNKQFIFPISFIVLPVLKQDSRTWREAMRRCHSGVFQMLGIAVIGSFKETNHVRNEVGNHNSCAFTLFGNSCLTFQTPKTCLAIIGVESRLVVGRNNGWTERNWKADFNNPPNVHFLLNSTSSNSSTCLPSFV